MKRVGIKYKLTDKSFLTNFSASLLILAGYTMPESGLGEYLTTIGVFAFSGAITNWLAIYMLFEKIPGLYGSGVIPMQFEVFKQGIKSMMMEQFFAKNHLDNILSSQYHSFIKYGIEKIDYEKLYAALTSAILNSSMGQMLSMFGGASVLGPLKEQIIAKLKQAITDFVLNNNLDLNQDGEFSELMQNKIEILLDQRLATLTPEMVKIIIQKMIRQHLGWLVVWGGVFGGALGGMFKFFLNM